MKVLLVRPLLLNMLTLSGTIDCEPLELEYLYTACREIGVEAVLYDGITETRPFSAVLRQEQPEVVAITGYITQENRMRRYAELARLTLPACQVVLGGVHAQLNARRLYFPTVDYIQRGESMEEWQALLRLIRDGGDPVTVSGLCWRDKGTFRENPYVPCDITRLPIPLRPAWEAHPDAFRYLDYPRVATVKTAVSCPFSCNFCYGTHLHAGRYQARSAELVAEELAGLSADNVFFVDSDFLVDEKRAWELAALLRQRNIRKTYICYARADFIARHPALIAALREVGFACFLVGLESVADQRLDAYQKGTTPSVNDACLQVLRECGAACVALMIADPSFTSADFRQLYAWARDSGLKYVSVQIYTPIPPTPLYQEKKTALLDHRPEKWDLAHLLLKPEHMTRTGFMLRHRWLMVRLYLLGWRRGVYRFFTPRFAAGRIAAWWKRRHTLR